MIVLILDPEWLGRDEVFEDSKEVCLRLAGREGTNRVISVDYDAVVITVHHNRRDCVVV